VLAECVHYNDKGFGWLQCRLNRKPHCGETAICAKDAISCRIAPVRPLSTRAHVSKTLRLAYLPQRCVSDFLPPACRRSSRGKKDRPPRPSLTLRADAAASATG
jgi:hypothetical protein